MKHKHDNNAALDASPHLVPVRFEFTHPAASAGCVAGSFNDWHLTPQARRSTGAGKWWKETDLMPGSYEYGLVVNGQWMSCQFVRSSAPNPSGGRNSILLKAGTPPEAAHHANAIISPLKNANKPKTQKI